MVVVWITDITNNLQQAGTTSYITFSGGVKASATNFIAVDGSSMSITVDVDPNAAPTARDLTITTPIWEPTLNLRASR